MNVYTRRPERWKSEIIGTTKDSTWAGRGDIVGKINLASHDPAAVSKGTKIFLICAPANAHQ